MRRTEDRGQMHVWLSHLCQPRNPWLEFFLPAEDSAQRQRTAFASLQMP